MKVFYTLIFMFLAGAAFAQSKLPTCKGDNYQQWNSCTGTIKGDDGSAYEGDFANGQINGYGLLTLPTGEKVLGQFKNSVLSGRGLLVGKDGSRYAGEFDQNIFNGQGISVLANGERIEGIFRNGQFVEAKKVTDAQIIDRLENIKERHLDKHDGLNIFDPVADEIDDLIELIRDRPHQDKHEQIGFPVGIPKLVDLDSSPSDR
jgi:hypothetical protein